MSFDDIKKSPQASKSDAQPSLDLTIIVSGCSLIQYFTSSSDRTYATSAGRNRWKNAINARIVTLIIAYDICNEGEKRIHGKHKKHDKDVKQIIIEE